MLCRKLLAIASATAFAATYLTAQTPLEPSPVNPSVVPTPPYSFNGLIVANGKYGSASMIGEGVFITAAQVVSTKNDDIFTWVAQGQIEYYPQFNSPDINGATAYPPVAYYKWDEYSSRVILDDSGPALLLPDTLNMDIAVGYFSESTEKDFIIQHAELHIDKENNASILQENRDKFTVGYPRESVPANEQGLMHATGTANLFSENAIFEDFDSGNFWSSIYRLEGITTSGGESDKLSFGGPIYVEDDIENNWMFSSIVVSTDGSSALLVRSVDENAWNGINGQGMIQQAIAQRNGNALVRVDDLSVQSATSSSVTLGWSNLSTEETGYNIFRREDDRYILLKQVDQNSQSYTDNTAESGKVYHYKVQPYKDYSEWDHTNVAPKSEPASVVLPGNYVAAQNYLDNDLLRIFTNGDSSWHIDTNNNLRAGEIHPFESSSLFLDIIGPGNVIFDWSASSEDNDALGLYMDGSPVEDGGVPVSISGPAPEDPTGIISETGMQLIVPAGAHLIEWRYEKDHRFDEHQDTGFLDSLTWSPDAASPYPVYGGYAVENSTWHASMWFGEYDARHWPWVEHKELGWLYMLGGTIEKGLFFNLDHPDLGHLYSTPDIWPFLYRPESATWAYYYNGSGSFGQGCLFFDYASTSWIETGG